jgi:hypothetical protein
MQFKKLMIGRSRMESKEHFILDLMKGKKGHKLERNLQNLQEIIN